MRRNTKLGENCFLYMLIFSFYSIDVDVSCIDLQIKPCFDNVVFG